MALIIPVLWGVCSIENLKAKVNLLLRYWAHVLLLGVFVFVGVLPQLLYWKYVTGNFVYYSYGDQGFSFLRPHLMDVLFSFRKGWLMYAPLMALAIVGFISLFRNNKAVFWACLVFFAVNLHIVASWDVWWYGGSMGQRALMQSYAVMAIPLGFLLLEVRQLPAVRTLTYVQLALFVHLNLFQTWQYMQNHITPEDMTREYYYAIFGKTQPTQSDITLLDTNERLKSEHRYNPKSIIRLDFESPAFAAETLPGLTSTGHLSARSQRMNPEIEYSATEEATVGHFGGRPGDWMKASVWVLPDWGAYGAKLVCTVHEGEQQLKWEGVRLQNNLIKGGKWQQVYYYFRLPEGTTPNSKVKVYVANFERQSFFIDNLELFLMEPK